MKYIIQRKPPRFSYQKIRAMRHMFEIKGLSPEDIAKHFDCTARDVNRLLGNELYSPCKPLKGLVVTNWDFSKENL